MAKALYIITDDDEDDRELISEELTAQQPDCKILECANGAQLLNVLEEQKISEATILLDLNMPVVNGFEVLSKIEADSSLKIIVLTTARDESTIQRVKKAGANAFAWKPASLAETRKLVEKICAFAGQHDAISGEPFVLNLR